MLRQVSLASTEANGIAWNKKAQVRLRESNPEEILTDVTLHRAVIKRQMGRILVRVISLLNLGYDLGVLTDEMFAILVLMALVTTFMTGPSLDLINRYFEPATEEDEMQLSKKNKYNILISLAHPHTGKTLLRIANMLTKKSTENSTVSALHLSPGNELNQFNAEEYERENFQQLNEESRRLNQPYHPIFKDTDDVEGGIVHMANNEDYDLLLTGIGQSVYEGTLLGKILGFTSNGPHRLPQ